MEQIFIQLPVSSPIKYKISLKEGLLFNVAHWDIHLEQYHHLVLITDHTVKNYYADTLIKAFGQHSSRLLLLTIKPGESSKRAKIKNDLENKMIKAGCGRDTLIIALGGGVIGDLAGFIAATYMRGISFIQIPTTLLAMVDSSIGGKTGINTRLGKNLIGAFWHPAAVIIDPLVLNTLSQQQLINGLFEAIKIFISSDKNSFNLVEQLLPAILNRERSILKKIILQAIQLKANIVMHDEKETGLRAILNLGHTVGHALEKLSNFKILHGYAVAMGILIEAKIAEHLQLLSSTEFMQIENLFHHLNIEKNLFEKFTPHQIWQACQTDKKNYAGAVRMPLINHIGQMFQTNQQWTHVISEDDLTRAFNDIIN